MQATGPGSWKSRGARINSAWFAWTLTWARFVAWFFFAVLAVCAIATLHGPRGGARVAYAIGTLLFAAGGAAIASRQVWLQHLPADKVPACGPGLFFMLENFPLAQTLKRLFSGSGECAVVDWTFLGLSIAEWSLACFVALALYAAWLLLRARRPAASTASA